MGAASWIRSIEGAAHGALVELVNVVTGSVAIPVGPLPSVPAGDVIEPVGPDARAGADLIDRIVRWAAGGASPVTPDTAREARPVLATTQLTVTPASDGGVQTTHVTFRANAAGLDWGSAGRESTCVAVYVDGVYVASTWVIAERPDAYDVNVGVLAPGAHTIELRHAADAGSAAAPTPTVSDVSSRVATGEAAEIDAHAPLLELRAPIARRAGEIVAASHTDTPLVLAPHVTHNADGTRSISYHVLFSNEDGGTLTPELMSQYGRAIDYECVYRVHLAADGRVLDAQYQAPIHRWVEFDGAKVGERPVLRVSTANNMVSARLSQTPGERWSDGGVAVAGGREPGDHDVLDANPWVWAVMGKELLREGTAKATGTHDGRHIADARRYVYLGPLTDVMRGALLARGGVEVELADGSTVFAHATSTAAKGGGGWCALELPDGALGDAVRGVHLIGVRALVLDSSFRPRQVTSMPAA